MASILTDVTNVQWGVHLSTPRYPPAPQQIQYTRRCLNVPVQSWSKLQQQVSHDSSTTLLTNIEQINKTCTQSWWAKDNRTWSYTLSIQQLWWQYMVDHYRETVVHAIVYNFLAERTQSPEVHPIYVLSKHHAQWSLHISQWHNEISTDLHNKSVTLQSSSRYSQQSNPKINFSGIKSQHQS